MASSTSSSDLPAASGLTGHTTSLPVPGEYPYLDAETQVPIIIGVSAALLVISSIVVVLRLYTRYWLIKVAGDDDITIGLAQLLNVGLAIITILQSTHGLGRHTWMVSQSDKIRQLELLLTSEVVYYAAQTMTKVSLLLQYRRIFRGKWTRLACLVLYIFVVLWCIVSIVLNSVACLPIADLHPSLGDVCLETLLVWSLTAAISIITNFAVAVVPIPATWALQLPRKIRIILTILFGLGFCTGAVAIARILTAKRSALSLDVTWDSVPVTYYSVIEVNVGIICACVITLRPLLTDIFPSLIKSSYGGHGDAAYYARERNNGTIHKTKKSSRETMTHADHGIYGLADLEVNRVLNGSQEGLTSAAPFEPAHFNTHRDNMPVGCPRMLTSITSGGKMPSRKLGEPLLPVHRIRTRSGDIMITRETTIREETVDPSTLGPMSPAEKDDQSWFTESSTRETQHPDSSSS